MKIFEITFLCGKDQGLQDVKRVHADSYVHKNGVTEFFAENKLVYQCDSSQIDGDIKG